MIRRLSDRFWNYLTDRIEARMHLRPDRDNTLDLGSSDYQWRRVYVGPGSVSAPAVTLDGDTDTGIYQSAADNLDIATGGVQRVNVSSAGLRLGPTGSQTAPALAFIDDTDTGIFRSLSNTLGFATGGVGMAQRYQRKTLAYSNTATAIFANYVNAAENYRWAVLAIITGCCGDLTCYRIDLFIKANADKDVKQYTLHGEAENDGYLKVPYVDFATDRIRHIQQSAGANCGATRWDLWLFATEGAFSL